jgi:ABC-2 type transport system ATP-binding protein
MQHVVVEDLRKSFRVSERRRGTLGAIAGLVARRSRTVKAIDGISFGLDQGELVGYIGPNGAGKSTTVKVLSGILVPDSGRVEVLGRVPWKERIAHVGSIGVVFGQRTQLWWDLPVVESFELLRDIYRVDPSDYRRTFDELASLLDLGALADTPVRQLSLGQRMRCDLAASLIHDPAILFLDEPTIGLDAVSKLAVRDFVRRRNRERGVTVILTTHDMDDIEALCSRVILIHRGRILFDGALEALRARVTNERELVVDLRDGAATVTDPDAIAVRQEGHRARISYDPQRIATPDLIARIPARYPVADLVVENPPIEEVVARLYRAVDT